MGGALPGSSLLDWSLRTSAAQRPTIAIAEVACSSLVDGAESAEISWYLLSKDTLRDHHGWLWDLTQCSCG